METKCYEAKNEADKTKPYERINYLKRFQEVINTAREKMPKLPYHNFHHAVDVYSAASRLALFCEATPEEGFLVNTAAFLHDIIVVPGAKDNEERSAEFAVQYLPKIGYSRIQAGKVGELILATKMPQAPKNFLEEIICDADLDNLGRPDFLDLGDKVRAELGLPSGETWYLQQLKFLNTHEYHTDAARSWRNAGKLENICRVESLLEEALESAKSNV